MDVLEPGAPVPTDYVEVPSLNGKQKAVIANKDIQDEYANYTSALGLTSTSNAEKAGGFINGPYKPSQEQAKVVAGANGVLMAAGLTNKPIGQASKVGVNFQGNPVYSDPALANDKDPAKGTVLAKNIGMIFGAMGAFADTAEAQKFVSMSDTAGDPAFHAQLDKVKQENNPGKFVSLLGASTEQAKFTAFKLYENWGNMSAAQKSIALGMSNIQNFKFADGKSVTEKKVTPEIPGVPAMSVGEGLNLAEEGINIAPVTRKWNQYSAIQETMYAPGSAADVAKTAESLGIAGMGIQGAAAEMSREKMAEYDIVPAPHFGVGAATIPAGQGAPVGYTALKVVNGRQVVVPKSNASTAVLDAPDVASDTAYQIYSRWKSEGIKQDKGIEGGSALVGGLHSMADTNPYSLGAVAGYASFENAGIDKNVSNLGYVTKMAGVALSRLSKGEATKDTDAAGLNYGMEGELKAETFAPAMKQMRSLYAKNGISSKEVGYQLANQAYAEGRLNESQLVAAQKSLDMVFDDNGHTLAQRLVTGKSKGIEITERRRG